MKHFTNIKDFNIIPGAPFAYWITQKTRNVFKHRKLSDYVTCKSGIMAGDEKYIKLWYEPKITEIKFDCTTSDEMGDYRWFPLNSGGEFRKWYGNNQKIIDLFNDGYDIKNNVKNYRLREKNYYFKPGITWGRIATSEIGFRVVSKGTLFGDAGPVGFINEGKFYVLGFLCSNVVDSLLEITNPTMNFQVHDIMNLPLIFGQRQNEVNNIVSQNINISKQDWDSFETSWGFKKHPLI